MKLMITTLLLATAIAAKAQVPEVHGTVFAGYTNDNMNVDRAALEVKYAFDKQYSAELALDGAGTGQDLVLLANVKGKDLLATGSLHDELVVGKHFGSYVNFIEENLGTRWIAPTFAMEAGLLPQTNTGAVYSLGLQQVHVHLSVSNSEVTHKSIYGGLVTGQVLNQKLHLAAGAQYDAGTEDYLYQAAAILHQGVGKIAVEYADQHNKEANVNDRQSYAATGACDITAKYGAYAQYLTGDSNWQAASAEKYLASAGPTVNVRKGIQVALLASTSQVTVDNSTNNGLGLRFAAQF